MQNGVYIYVRTSEREVNYSHLRVAVLSNMTNWNSGRNSSPGNVYYFPPGQEAGVHIRIRVTIILVQMFMDIMRNLF